MTQSDNTPCPPDPAAPRRSRWSRVLALAGALLAASGAIAARWYAVGILGSSARPAAARVATAQPEPRPMPAVLRPATAVTSPAAPTAAPLGDPWAVPGPYRGTLVRQRVRFFPQKLLALTFDDGPDPVVTPRVLAALAAHGAHATFFVQGSHAARHPELLRAIAAGGNAIGNHSYTHPSDCSPSEAAEELERTEKVILDATGRRPVLFRPPYGIVRGSLERAALAEGYTSFLWTISSADTRPITSAVIARNVIHTPNPGDIVIMHDGPGHERTAEALPQVLDELSAAGFRFVTLPDLMRSWNDWLPSRPVAQRGTGPSPHSGAPRPL